MASFECPFTLEENEMEQQQFDLIVRASMPNKENIESAFELAASQWELFTTAQALAADASRTQLSRLAAHGRKMRHRYLVPVFHRTQATAMPGILQR